MRRGQHRPGRSESSAPRQKRRQPAAEHSATEAPAWRSVLPSLVALSLFLGATAVFVSRHVPVDDAYITFRYAQSVAAGAGAVFNLGERVEGYSSLSWLLLLAAVDGIGLPVPLAAVVLGLACGIAVLLTLARRGGAGALAAVLTALFLPFSYHSANGLETALTTLLVTVLTTAYPRDRGFRWAVLTAAALLPVTRPEGLGLVLLWWAARSLLVRDEAARWRHLAAAAGVSAWLAQLGWRLAYYGEWMPNAARAKLLPFRAAIPHGVRDLAGFAWAASAWGVLLLALLAAIWRAARDRDASSQRQVTLAAALFLFGASGLLALSGGDSFPLWRFFVPIAPTFFLLAASGLWRPLREEVKRAEVKRAEVKQAGVKRPALGRWALATIAIIALSTQYQSAAAAVAREGTWVAHWRAMGEALRVHFSPPTTTIALCPVGALPYYSGLRTIDMLGLTEPRVARTPADLRYWYPGHQRHDGRHVLDRRPDLIMLGNGPRVPQPGPFDWRSVRVYERDLAADPRLREDYRLWHLPLRDGTFAQLFVRAGVTPHRSSR